MLVNYENRPPWSIQVFTVNGLDKRSFYESPSPSQGLSSLITSITTRSCFHTHHHPLRIKIPTHSTPAHPHPYTLGSRLYPSPLLDSRMWRTVACVREYIYCRSQVTSVSQPSGCVMGWGLWMCFPFLWFHGVLGGFCVVCGGGGGGGGFLSSGCRV